MNYISKFILIFSSVLLFCFSSFGQATDEITKSGNYLYAIGDGVNYDDADQSALHRLSSQIAVHVESRYHYEVMDSNNRFRELLKYSVQTYTTESLYRAGAKLIDDKENHIKVMRFIEKSDVDRLFNQRVAKIKDYYRAGERALLDLRISDALRNFYWSWLFLQSHPDKDTIHYIAENFANELLVTKIPDILTSILTSLEINVRSVEKDTQRVIRRINLSVKYRNVPVGSFDFSYWAGDGYTRSSCTEGVATIELSDLTEVSLISLKINAEYKFIDLAKSYDPDLYTIMQGARLPPINKSEFTIMLKPSEKLKITPSGQQTPKQDEFTCEKMVRKILQGIENKSLDRCSEYFTADGLSLMTKMLRCGDIQILGSPDSLHSVRLNKITEVRSIPVKFRFQKNQREFVENLVFTFDSSNHVENVSFSLSARALNDIISKGKDSREDKFTIIHFLESFKTAYFLKREDYLNQIFSDNALIIVGTMLKTDKTVSDLYNMFDDKKVKYIRLNKSSYFERLHRVFQTNDFVRLHFEETIIQRRNGDDKTYGIQLEQYYSSTTYSDKGYLTLVLDLNDSLKPRIYVRVWQPRIDSSEGWIGLNSFYN